MSDIIADYFIIVLIILGLVIYPITRELEYLDNATQKRVDKVTNEFTQEVRSKGYISMESYTRFITKLASTNNIYSIEIEHKVEEVYPLDANDPRYTIDKPYIPLYKIYTKQQIIDTLKSGKDYIISSGDNFNVTVKNKNDTPYQAICRMLDLGTKVGISTDSGGVVH